MYKDPGELDFAVKPRKEEVLGADAEWRALVESGEAPQDPFGEKSSLPHLRLME